MLAAPSVPADDKLSESWPLASLPVVDDEPRMGKFLQKTPAPGGAG